MGEFMRVEDLQVYQKLCQLHIDVCKLTRDWPPDERYELTGQARRSSNSAPAQLAEKHSDRHLRNKIEGVNRARGEALETVHHPLHGNAQGLSRRAKLRGLSRAIPRVRAYAEWPREDPRTPTAHRPTAISFGLRIS
jgi:four helix bundle protein